MESESGRNNETELAVFAGNACNRSGRSGGGATTLHFGGTIGFAPTCATSIS